MPESTSGCNIRRTFELYESVKKYFHLDPRLSTESVGNTHITRKWLLNVYTDNGKVFGNGVVGPDFNIKVK